MLDVARTVRDLLAAGGAPSRETRVYFIQVVGDGQVVEEAAIKIGIADDPVRRWAQLQIATPHELMPIGSVPAPAGLEAAIHRELEPYRIRREWFRPTPEVLALIDTVLDELRDDWDDQEGFA